MKVDPTEWSRELSMQREFFEKFGPKLPFEFRDQLKNFEGMFGLGPVKSESREPGSESQARI
jgi:hypothetical protein